MGPIMPGRVAQPGSPRNAFSLRREASHESLLIESRPTSGRLMERAPWKQSDPPSSSVARECSASDFPQSPPADRAWSENTPPPDSRPESGVDSESRLTKGYQYRVGPTSARFPVSSRNLAAPRKADRHVLPSGPVCEILVPDRSTTRGAA